MPLVQTIPAQAHAALDPMGGYGVQHTTDYRLEGLISLSRGHSQVSGCAGNKPGYGWSTLVTTVLEDLNAMQVLMADRVVGQTITEHPLVGHVPTISFLGTWFDNPRIAGHPIHLNLNLDLIGPKPPNDAPYIRDPEFLQRVSNQYSSILGIEDLPEDLRKKYNDLAADLGKTDTVECSLVNLASGSYPGRTFGHIIRIPEFGTITLGRLKITQEDPDPVTGSLRKTTVTLTMVDLKLGCAIEADIPIGTGSTNGNTYP
jgi:hypothetical protein